MRISDWSSDVCSSDLVAQYYALDDGVGITGAIEGKASIWAEAIEPVARDVRTLATYKDAGGWLDGTPAIVTRKVGRVSLTYDGAWLDPDAMGKLSATLPAPAPVEPLLAETQPHFALPQRTGPGPAGSFPF